MDKEIFRHEMAKAASKPKSDLSKGSYQEDRESCTFALFVKVVQSIAEELKEIKILLRQRR